MAQNPFLKIFLVDDDIFSLSLYKQFLNKLGYTEISTFTSGEDCLEELQEQPDIIFLDYNMEGLNGLEVLKKVKEHDPSIMVYLISGKEDPETATNAKQFGAVDYIVKSSLNPAKMKSVMEVVEEFIPQATKQQKKSLFQRFKSGFGI